MPIEIAEYTSSELYHSCNDAFDTDIDGVNTSSVVQVMRSELHESMVGTQRSKVNIECSQTVSQYSRTFITVNAHDTMTH